MYTEGTAAPQSDLSSNLYEIRNRLHSYTEAVRAHTYRLNRKNEQLIHVAESSPKGSGKLLSTDSVARRDPLISELNAAAVDLEYAIEQLSAAISITETI